MVQFKPVFLGVRDIGFTRATTCQKCVRTTDIDIIGTTGRHHSFFEMLGNFSFGDYFKSEACAWAYEYSTEVLAWIRTASGSRSTRTTTRPRRSGATRSACRPTGSCAWAPRTTSGRPAPPARAGRARSSTTTRARRWAAARATCAPGCDCDRFLEYWNLVFMQYDRAEDGTLTPLPKQNIDTGMGLERVAAIMQGVHSNFETDDLRALDAQSPRRSPARRWARSRRPTSSLRILADHARAVAFLIADGVLPSNEGRGYVLRRLLRRAIRHGRLLGVETPFMMRLIDDRHRADGARRIRNSSSTRTSSGASSLPRRSASARRSGRGLRSSRRRSSAHALAGEHRPRRQRGVHAPRHVRLPLRAHRRDRCRGGSRGRCRCVRRRHGRRSASADAPR